MRDFDLDQQIAHRLGKPGARSTRDDRMHRRLIAIHLRDHRERRDTKQALDLLRRPELGVHRLDHEGEERAECNRRRKRNSQHPLGQRVARLVRYGRARDPGDVRIQIGRLADLGIQLVQQRCVERVDRFRIALQRAERNGRGVVIERAAAQAGEAGTERGCPRLACRRLAPQVSGQPRRFLVDTGAKGRQFGLRLGNVGIAGAVEAGELAQLAGKERLLTAQVGEKRRGGRNPTFRHRRGRRLVRIRRAVGLCLRQKTGNLGCLDRTIVLRPRIHQPMFLAVGGRSHVSIVKIDADLLHPLGKRLDFLRTGFVRVVDLAADIRVDQPVRDPRRLHRIGGRRGDADHVRPPLACDIEVGDQLVCHRLSPRPLSRHGLLARRQSGVHARLEEAQEAIDEARTARARREFAIAVELEPLRRQSRERAGLEQFDPRLDRRLLIGTGRQRRRAGGGLHILVGWRHHYRGGAAVDRLGLGEKEDREQQCRRYHQQDQPAPSPNDPKRIRNPQIAGPGARLLVTCPHRVCLADLALPWHTEGIGVLHPRPPR